MSETSTRAMPMAEQVQAAEAEFTAVVERMLDQGMTIAAITRGMAAGTETLAAAITQAFEAHAQKWPKPRLVLDDE